MYTKVNSNLPLLSGLALTSAALLSACGPEGEFEDAINAELQDREMCWNISSSKPVTFPIKVKRSFGSSQDLHPILAGLQAQGLVELEVLDTKFIRSDKIDLTSEGERHDIWTDGEGFCLGAPEVVEIVRFTYADNGQNENAASVEFTYQYEEVPSWLDRDAFAGIPGMADPEEGYAEVQKSSDGWHASSWF
ncbi:hypothetical protein [Roseovarius sp.]|uniref:hypothetical protein n=1 Tax=Roseovarius sp. TaxID=1486281 RepID=UPI003D13EDC3